MKKVAVTGASGHLGANLVRELIQRGYKVVALVRQTSLGLEGLDIERVQGDVSDLESLCRAFHDVDDVYHLAAHVTIRSGEDKKLQSVNVTGTRNVLEACLSEGVSTLVHFSSIHALDLQPLDRGVTEENLLLDDRQDGSEYDHSKAQSDKLVREQGNPTLSTRIIYPTAVFGPNDFKLSTFGQAILKIANGRMPALVSGGFDFVDARDVAWGAVEAAEKGADKDRFILSGQYLSVHEVASVIAGLAGTAAPRFTTPIWLARLFEPVMGAWASVSKGTPVYTRDSLAALSSNKLMSHARAAGMLGYQPRPFGESMRDTLQYYAQQKWIREIPDGD